MPLSDEDIRNRGETTERISTHRKQLMQYGLSVRYVVSLIYHLHTLEARSSARAQEKPTSPLNSPLGALSMVEHPD